MKIYEYLTFKFNNYKDVETVLKKYKTSQVNILFTNQFLSLLGPHVMTEFEELFKKKKVNLIAEVGTNIGLALTLIELDVKKISISKNFEKKILNKVKSLAQKKNIKILVTEKFQRIINTNKLI
ncbi:MAG: hypothetical protein VX009_02205 [Pseudomonadota bacterium]|nr:hypothetical protein [Pseudomonadota bacterium]